jgi:hypothetical protein
VINSNTPSAVGVVVTTPVEPGDHYLAQPVEHYSIFDTHQVVLCYPPLVFVNGLGPGKH